KALASWPSAKRRMVPSVITPSTSLRTSFRAWQRRARSSSFTPARPSYHLGVPEVVEVDDAKDGARVVRDHECRDLARFHAVERAGGELAAADDERLRRHALARGPLEERVPVLLELTANVSVGQHAHEPAAVDHRRHPQPLLRHLEEDVLHHGPRLHPR